MTKHSLASTCEQAIEKRILNGEFAPGTRLHNGTLAQEYGVTISPIREALSRLTITGLVQFIDKKGFFITEIDEADFIDLTETFADIECLALEKAMLRGDEQWEANIAAELHRLQKVETGKKVSYTKWAEYNHAFHRALIAGCDSPHLLKCRELIHRQYERYLRLIYFDAGETEIKANHEEHRQIAEATLARKSSKAIKLMRAHIVDGQTDIIKKLKKVGLLSSAK